MKLSSFIQHKHSSYKSINWLELFSEGNRRAFSHYFEVLYPSLFHYAHKVLADPEAAKKIVLSAFVHTWKQREDFTTLDQMKLFIRETVRNNCSTYRLSQGRERKPENTGIAAVFMGWEKKGPHMERIHKEILAEMFQKLERLPEDSKWVLHHAITDHKSRTQLAEEWHISENAAAIRKSRAFKALLSLMSEPAAIWFILMLWVRLV